MKRNSRDDIIDDVRRGHMTPDQAEAEARRLGMEPLAKEPDASDFEPMKEANWTLVMAAAWIAYRTAAAVREWWDEYREERWVWRFRRWQVPGGPIYDGHELENPPPASLALFQISERADPRPDRDPALSMTSSEAIEALWVALRSDCFAARGVDLRMGERVDIPVEQWRDLEWFGERGRDVIRASDPRLTGGAQYKAVTVPMRSVVGIWRSTPKPKPYLPDLMKPEGVGHMPLFCAAQWIATGGGERTFDPTDRSKWQLAIDNLLENIAAGALIVTGKREGQREPIPSHLFIDCRVCYPFENELPFAAGEDLYLRFCPYLDDEHWREGFNDALLHRSTERWSQLMVSKPDVRGTWPFELDETMPRRPGRPALIDDAFLAEWVRRLEAHELEASLKRQAEVLIAWHKTQFPHKRQPTRTPVEKYIRSAYREAKRTRN